MNSRPRGFTALELLVVVAVLGVLLAAATPLLLGWSTTSLTAGAEEVKALLNRARFLAVAESTSVCITGAGPGVRFLLGGCTGPAWTGSGAGGDGVIRLASEVQIAAASPVVFTYLGAAAPAGSYTLVEPRDGTTVRVVVSASGRIAVAR